VSVHDYHEMLPGFSEAQVLHDGCKECETRGADPALGIVSMDGRNFAAAWQRAAQWNTASLPDLAQAEIPLFRVLWAIQLKLETRGVPIGEMP
jgi:hypothetical protein